MPSLRDWPKGTPKPEYDWPWMVRQVSDGGQMKWGSRRVFLSHALSGHSIGFEPLAEGVWRVWFYRHRLGLWDERKQQFQWEPCREEAKPTQGSPAG